MALTGKVALTRRAADAKSTNSNSFEYHFVDTIHQRFICTICTKVMKDPHLVVCCGQKFCCLCLENWLMKKRTRCCPHCRATTFQHVLEKGMKSEIESFHILCSNHKEGCEWIGELRELDKHFKSDKGCLYYAVECPNKCESTVYWGTTKIIRKSLQDHVDNHCELRLEKCQYCDYVGTVRTYSTHERVCKMFPMKCPNSCGEQGIVRQTLGFHRQKCKLEVIECVHATIGCTEELIRQDMQDHLDQHCELRQMKCEYCDYAGTVKNYPNHENVCELFPIECPNGCEDQGIVRQTLVAHLLECKLGEVDCQYAHVGCIKKLRRMDMPQHVIDHQGDHLEMATKAYTTAQQELGVSQQAVRKIRSTVLKELSLFKRDSSLPRHEYLLSLKILLDCAAVKK